MPNIKNKFTLHTAYKDFVPGQDQDAIPMEVLSPHIDNGCACLVNSMAATFVLVMILVIGASFLHGALIEELFKREGQAVIATVTSCKMYQPKRGDASPIVDYIYTVDVAHEGQDYLNGRCEHYSPGTKLSAEYLPSQPFISHISQPGLSSRSPDLGLPMSLIGIAALFCLSLGWTSFGQVRRYLYARSKRASLATTGVLLNGRITAINGYKPYKYDTYYVRVWYTFQTPRKKVLKGYAEAHRQDLKDKLPPVGTPVTVLYADDGSHMML